MSKSYQLENAWIGLCSNLGDRAENLSKAVAGLKNLENVRVRVTSGVYRSAAAGEGFSGDFYNAVVAVETQLSPLELQKVCWRIESEYEQKDHSLDRIIDIDVLLFGSEIINSPQLTLPHPRLMDSRFVLQPLAEIAADRIHPVAAKTVRELLNDLTGEQDVTRLPLQLAAEKDT